jgi:gamma-glutamylcyclotransferase (GGCT)/AIG2-like uncharacterized protein YtfP
MESAIFTYGTLMPRDPESAARQGCEPDAVRGRLYDLGPYPALVDLGDLAAGWVEGYVRHGVTIEMMRRLDAHEETDSGLYRRVQTTTRNNSVVWVYVYRGPLPRDARGPLTRWEGTVRAWPCPPSDSPEGDS